MFDHLYLNQGNLTFRDITRYAGVSQPGASSSVRVADIDNDGWQDMIVTTYGAYVLDINQLYHNNGNNTFSDLFPQSGLPNGCYIACDWGDINNDGLVDLFLLGHVDYYFSGLWYCTGFGSYSLAFVPPGAYAFGCDAQFCDFDNDRDLDLFIGLCGYNRLYENENGSFHNISISAGISGNPEDFTYPIIGDFDNDGLFDIFTINFPENINSRDCLYRQINTMRFRDAIIPSGIEPTDETYCGAWGDLDNDGWLDLLTFGWGDMTRFWHNNGDGTFADVAQQAGLCVYNSYASSLALGDINNDGFLDIYLVRWSQANRLFLNEGNDNHWLQVCLVGTTSNRLGIGARAKAVAGNLVQWRDLGGGKFAGSSNAPFIHFGLGENTIVDSMYICWPSGNVSIFTDIPADQRIYITEGAREVNLVSQNPTSPNSSNHIRVQPNPFNSRAEINLEISTAGQVNLSLYNLRGELVETLVNSYYTPGNYIIQFEGTTLSSGIYFVFLRTEMEYRIKKIMIIK
jgi:hypothetical protein